MNQETGQRIRKILRRAAAVLLCAAVFLLIFPAGAVQAGSADDDSLTGASGEVPMYRLYNLSTGEHLFTADEHEKKVLTETYHWRYEGIGWYAPASGTPVYRLYNTSTGEHFYTMDRNERRVLISQYRWTDENLAFYSDDGHRYPVYRQFNAAASPRACHNYTGDTNEVRVLTGNHGWKNEGVCWYGTREGEKAKTQGRGMYGVLSVSGTDLTDVYGNAVRLKGISTHGIAWYPAYINQGAFQYFRDQWGANTIRLAMYTAEYGGYCTGGDRAKLEALVDSGVQAASALGMYVIIDWHILSDSNPKTYQSQAVDFFRRMSAKYADYGNVLYEICNEPNGGTTWGDIRSYADAVIQVIRANDPDSVILVGTPTWSQDIDKAASDRLPYNNIMYSLHFYAATHKDQLRSRLVSAHNSGLPVFIDEFSTVETSGNGNVDYASAEAWKQLILQYHLSYVGWNLSNKNESSAILRENVTSVSGGWSDGDFKASGLWLKGLMQSS